MVTTVVSSVIDIPFTRRSTPLAVVRNGLTLTGLIVHNDKELPRREAGETAPPSANLSSRAFQIISPIIIKPPFPMGKGGFIIRPELVYSNQFVRIIDSVYRQGKISRFLRTAFSGP